MTETKALKPPLACTSCGAGMARVTVNHVVQIQPAALDRELSAAYLALSVTTFEKLVREQSLPQPRRLSGRRVAWVRAELDAWLMERPISELLPPPNTGALKPRSEHSRGLAL